MFKLLPLLAALLMHGCMTDSNTLEVSGKGAEQAERDFKAEFDRPNVVNVYVENNQLIIEGSTFHHVDKIKIKGTGDQAFNDEFTIESKKQNRIVANSKRNITYLVGAMFDLVLSNAYGSATYSVSFTIPDGGVTGKKINRMNANPGEVLAWNATDEEWEPAALNSINVLGAWDPVANNDPEIVTGGYASIAPPSGGDFWIITQAHDFGVGNEINGIQIFGAGDWIFWDDTKNAGSGAWIRIQNTQQVTRVNTKTGDVTLNWDDIPKTGSTIDDIEDVDTTTSAPSTGQVLKWDGSNWTPQTDDSTTYNGVVNGTAIQNGAITDEDINATAAIQTSKIDGLDAALADRLTLSTGGTMAGDIDMGNNSISNINLVDGENINQMRTDINSNASVLSTAFGSNTAAYVRGNGTPATLDSDVVPEGSTNFYFTVDRVRGTPLTGFVTGADVSVNTTDTVLEAFGKLQAQVSQAKSDAAGGGDLLADGTVNMSGDFNVGGNDITNVGTITTSTLLDSQGLFTANGLWGSNVTVPTFQFEMQDDAAGLTLVTGTAQATRGDSNLTIAGFNAQTEFANGDYIYLHGIPYKVSNRPNATTITLDVFMPYSAQNMVVHKGKAGIAFFDSGRIPTYSFDLERGDMRIGTYAAINEDSSRIEARTVGRTTANGSHNTNMLTLENRSFIVDTFTNSGQQSVAKLSAYRNSFTDGAPEDEGTLALQKVLELNYGHKNASGTASSITTTMKGLEINAFNQAGSITNSYDIHVTEPTGAIDATNSYGIVIEGSDKANIIEGTLQISDDGSMTAAQDGNAGKKTKLLIDGHVELSANSIFYGDGSGLTGISASGATSADDNPIVGDSNNNGTGAIKFKIGTDGGGDNDVVATIDNQGQMGLGVLDASHKLQVVGDTQLDVRNGQGVYYDLNGATVFGMEEVGTSGTVHFGNENNLDSGINFETSTGAVGVGTNDPRGIFEVSDVLYDDGNCADNPGYTGADIDGDADNTDCRKTGLVVASDANVGIGTTSPSTELEVSGRILANNVKSYYVEKTLGTTANDYVDLVNINGALNIIEMSIIVGDTAKTYKFTVHQGDDSTSKRFIRPQYTEAEGADDFDLLGDYSTSVLLLRVRRNAGTTSTVKTHIKSLTNNTFTDVSNSGSGETHAVTSYYRGTPFRAIEDKVTMGRSFATGEHLAVSVGNGLANTNFALTDESTDPNGYEFRISSNDLIMSRVTTMNSSPTSTADYTFGATGTLSATAFSGNGSALTNVTAATVTDPGTNIVFTVDNDNGTPVDTSSFSFKNGSTATEVLTIDGDGNMGINTTDITTETYTNIPSSSASFDRSMIIQGEGGVTGANTAGKGTLVLSNSKRGVAGTGILSSTEAGAIEFIVAGNEGGTTGAGAGDVDDDIDAGDTIAYMISSLSGSGSDDGASYTDGYGGKISFYTKSDNSLSVLERFTIDHTGDVNVATGSGSIRIGGTEVCTSAGCPSPSDERLKENVEPLKDSLQKLLALEGVSYDWINTEKYGDKHQIGFLAQQLEMFFPEIVNTDDKTGLKSVSYGHLVAPMVEALKEHNAMIEANKEMYETMQGRIEAIEAHNEKQDREIASLKEENKMLKSYICSKDPDAPFCN